MTKWKRIAGITLVASAAIGSLIGAVVVYAGLYNISATEQHTAFVYQLLEISMRRSVKLRTTGITAPPLDDTNRTVNGFRHFQAHCIQCHGAPGIAPQPFALGLTPAPSPLVATAKSLPAADIYWIIRNGIKMSGMPAWQYRLSDKEIWDVVAFLKVLPSLTPADYQTWRGRYPLKQTQPENAQTSPSAKVRLGDVSAGKKALQQHLCITCHVIPGVVGPNRLIGPPLAGIASRQYIAGVLPNTPENMVRWIRNPTEVDPLTAMPDLNVSEQDAHDIAAFLSTLREQ